MKLAVQQFSNFDAVKEQLSYTRRALTAKTRSIKALSAEANAKDQEVKQKDVNLENLRRDLLEKKQKLLCEKRDKHKLKLQLDAIKQQINNTGTDRPMSNPVGQLAAYKTGAGFRVPGAYAFDY